jgi:uncharacterized protein (DUF169 family)
VTENDGRRENDHRKLIDPGKEKKMSPFSETSWQTFREVLGLKEPPLGIYYTNEKPEGLTPKPGIQTCMVGFLQNARKKGETVYFDKEHFGCPGGAYYMGFFDAPRPNIEHFLSCGIPGQMEGERYIKTPELAKRFILSRIPRRAPGAYCIFKPIDKFQGHEKPEVVVLFATPDTLSGLFTLTNYALEKTDAVHAPFASGCGTILTIPLKEAVNEHPRAILGMFDVSARPMVEKDILTLAMPYSIFLKLLEDVSGSFLETESWKKVRSRIVKPATE